MPNLSWNIRDSYVLFKFAVRVRYYSKWIDNLIIDRFSVGDSERRKERLIGEPHSYCFRPSRNSTPAHWTNNGFSLGDSGSSCSGDSDNSCITALKWIINQSSALSQTPFLHFPTVCPGRFWHITDLHLDPSYHMSPDPTKVCLSSHGDPVTQAGVFGDFLCDSPYSLIQSAFAHMASLTQPEDFIIWTGLVGHGAEGGGQMFSRVTYSTVSSSKQYLRLQSAFTVLFSPHSCLYLLPHFLYFLKNNP